jgi:hypothetical protein
LLGKRSKGNPETSVGGISREHRRRDKRKPSIVRGPIARQPYYLYFRHFAFSLAASPCSIGARGLEPRDRDDGRDRTEILSGGEKGARGRKGGEPNFGASGPRATRPTARERLPAGAPGDPSRRLPSTYTRPRSEPLSLPPSRPNAPALHRSRPAIFPRAEYLRHFTI